MDKKPLKHWLDDLRRILFPGKTQRVRRRYLLSDLRSIFFPSRTPGETGRSNHGRILADIRTVIAPGPDVSPSDRQARRRVARELIFPGRSSSEEEVKTARKRKRARKRLIRRILGISERPFRGEDRPYIEEHEAFSTDLWAKPDGPEPGGPSDYPGGPVRSEVDDQE